MYLIDTNVISEMRKASKADASVRAFFDRAAKSGQQVYIASVTVGELRRGIESVLWRGDFKQAALLETWLQQIIVDYKQNILSLDADAAQIWGRLRVPDPQHALDKQIAAIALIWNLTVVTRNVKDFQGLGVALLNPFLPP